jgi:hemerythrin-like domain-containing protein
MKKQPRSKSAKAGRAGRSKPRIFQLLRDDHREAIAMLEEICDGKMSEPERLRRFSEFRAALMAHSLAESRAFYAPLKRQLADAQAVREADVEHLIVDRLLEDLSGTLFAGDRWLARATVLKELIEHHVKEEESEIFGMAQKKLNSAALEEIADDFVVVRGRIVETVA